VEYVYSDKTLTCADCGQEFIFTASEQEFYAARGFSEPRRCPTCRAARKAQRNDSGYSSGSRGGYGGYDSGSRPPREMFAGPNVLEVHEVMTSTDLPVT